MDLAIMAGAVSTALFTSSTLPMVWRALRTRDLASYSRGHLVLTNVGNLVHTCYVLSLPLGPVYALHAVHTGTAMLMLIWHLRYVLDEDRDGPASEHDAEPRRTLCEIGSGGLR